MTDHMPIWLDVSDHLIAALAVIVVFILMGLVAIDFHIPFRNEEDDDG